MKLSKSNKVFLVILIILFGIQFWYATTSACPAEIDIRKGATCWGPRGIEIFGLNFNKAYVSGQLIIFFISLIATFPGIITFIKFGSKNRVKQNEELFNLIFKIFSIFYIVFSLGFLFLNFRYIY